MKKMIAMLLVLVMVLSLFAGCGNKNNVEETLPEETQPATDAPTVDEPAADEPAVDEPAVENPGASNDTAAAGALEILEKIWAATGDSEKFPSMGGDANNMVDGAPGIYGLEDVEMLTAQLLVPADQVANIDGAASLFHGMMLNNFTCGVFHVTGKVNTFAQAMYDAVMNNQWMCGCPERVLIAVIDSEYVLMAFGLNDIINPLLLNVKEAHDRVDILYMEEIA